MSGVDSSELRLFNSAAFKALRWRISEAVASGHLQDFLQEQGIPIYPARRAWLPGSSLPDDSARELVERECYSEQSLDLTGFISGRRWMDFAVGLARSLESMQASPVAVEMMRTLGINTWEKLWGEDLVDAGLHTPEIAGFLHAEDVQRMAEDFTGVSPNLFLESTSKGLRQALEPLYDFQRLIEVDALPDLLRAVQDFVEVARGQGKGIIWTVAGLP